MNIRTSFALLTLSIAGAAQANLNFGNFNDVSSLTLNGNAHVVDGKLRLTDAQQWQGSTVWSKDKQNVAGGFDTTFSYYIGGGDGADGLTFTLNGSNNTTGLGDLGGHLAMDGIDDTYGVQIRTYIYDKIQIGGYAYDETSSVANNNLAGTHSVRVKYVPGLMSVFFDGTEVLSRNVDLGAKYENGAYVGFTSATGGSSDIHQINSWGFTETQAVPEPASMAALGLGGLALIRRRRSQKA